MRIDVAQIVTKGRHKMGVLLATGRNETPAMQAISAGFQSGEPGAFIRYRKDVMDADRAELLRICLGASCGAVAVGHNSREERTLDTENRSCARF